MLETQEQIDLTLSFCGETLEFNNGTLLGIPGDLVFNVQSFDSPYDIKKQDFNFQVAHKSFFSLSIQPKDRFLYTLNNKIYKFEIISFTDDLTGWIDLQVKLIEVL